MNLTQCRLISFKSFGRDGPALVFACLQVGPRRSRHLAHQKRNGVELSRLVEEAATFLTYPSAVQDGGTTMTRLSGEARIGIVRLYGHRHPLDLWFDLGMQTHVYSSFEFSYLPVRFFRPSPQINIISLSTH